MLKKAAHLTINSKVHLLVRINSKGSI